MPRSSKKPAAPKTTAPQREALRAMLGNPTKSLHRWTGGLWSVAMPEYGDFDGQFFNQSLVNAAIQNGIVDVSRSSPINGAVEIRLNHVSYEVLKCPTN